MIVEYHWHVHMKLDKGVCLTLEARRRVEEEEKQQQHARLNYEGGARIV